MGIGSVGAENMSRWEGVARAHGPMTCLLCTPESDSQGDPASPASILLWQTEALRIESGLNAENNEGVPGDRMALRFWPVGRA